MKTQEKECKQYIASIDTGRNSLKSVLGLRGAKPKRATEIFSCCPVKGSIDPIQGNLHVVYQGKEYAFGKEAAIRYGTPPDTSDNPYISEGALSPGYYTCLWGGLENLLRTYPAEREIDLHLVLTLPEQHLGIRNDLRRLLTGRHEVQFDDGVRVFNVSPKSLYLIHQPKGILYCHQYILCDDGNIRPRQIDEGTRINVTDLGSVTLYNANYTWFQNNSGQWGWDCPINEFQQSTQGHWSLLEIYRKIAKISSQEDVWRVEKRWKQEAKEIKRAVIQEHLSALNILNNSKYCDERLIGGGGYYDLAGDLPFEARYPESFFTKRNADGQIISISPEFFQAEGNWKLLHYLTQTTGGML